MPSPPPPPPCARASKLKLGNAQTDATSISETDLTVGFVVRSIVRVLSVLFLSVQNFRLHLVGSPVRLLRFGAAFKSCVII